MSGKVFRVAAAHGSILAQGSLPRVVREWYCGQLMQRRELPQELPSSRVVVHSNHPNEIDDACSAALLRLVKSGVPVLNQTVLLRGVNDDADTLTELSRRLMDARVMPYYLHQLDPVTGAQHWEVPVARGQELIAELRTRLPGFGVPRYVREVIGAAHKVDISSGPA